MYFSIQSLFCGLVKEGGGGQLIGFITGYYFILIYICMIELWFYSRVYTLPQVTVHGHEPLAFIIFFLFCRDYRTRLKRKMKRWKKKWLVSKQLNMWMDIILNIVIVCVNKIMWLSLNLVSQHWAHPLIVYALNSN